MGASTGSCTRRPKPGRTAPAPPSTPAELVARLSHPNGWWRDTAQRLLVERGDTSVVPALKKIAASAPDQTTRLHALWTLDGLDSLDAGLVSKALADPARDVRVSAVRLAERWLSEPASPLQSAVLKLETDPDWAVRQQLAASLGSLPSGVRETAIAGLLARHGNDPVTVDAALSGVRDSETMLLGLLVKSAAETPQLAESIAMTTATIVRGAQDGPVQDVFTLLAQNERPLWQRSALMRGAESALLPAGGGRGGRGGRGLAGGAGRGAGTGAPAPAGARGGPGSAPAFARAAAEPRNQGGVTAMPLRSEPALVKVASETGDLGTRATALLARLTWPGKPNAAPAAVPLTAEEQQRFAAGREVYQTLCIACHQADGRGREQLAPSLIGSELALGPAGIAARIVVGGKEGQTGLMPPLGASLTDDQIAAALTYIRREWGHTAPAVDPATVKEVRSLSTGRTRPWTNEELARLRQGQF